MDNRGGNGSSSESDGPAVIVKNGKSITYYTQVAVIIVVVIASIINLSFGKEPQILWIALLTSCVGYVLPNPRLGSDVKHITMKESLMVSDGSTNVNNSVGYKP